jgi:hypothetical protein
VPTYTSTNTSDIIVKGPDGYYTIYPGNNELNFYLQSLPSGVTFTSHTPQVNPYVKIADVTSFPSTGYAVNRYESIIISNKTDSLCVFYANDDSTQTLELSSGASLIIDNTKQEWGLLTINSAGAGTVSIWGLSTPKLLFSSAGSNTLS